MSTTVRLIDSQIHKIREACLPLLSGQPASFMVDVEDLVNDTYIALVEYEDRYQPHLGSLSAWVYRTSRTICARQFLMPAMGYKRAAMPDPTTGKRGWVRREVVVSQIEDVHDHEVSMLEAA